MTTQTTPRPSEVVEQLPTQNPARENHRLAIGIVALVASAAVGVAVAVMAPGATRPSIDGSWQRAELNRMIAIDRGTRDTSHDSAELQRQLALANIDESSEIAEFSRQAALARTDEPHDTAEYVRQSGLAPTVDASHEAAESIRMRSLEPKTDTSNDVAEFGRMKRLAR